LFIEQYKNLLSILVWEEKHMIKFINLLWIAITLATVNIQPLQAGNTFLYIYTDPKNVGEYNQLKGIAHSLQQIASNTMKQEEFDTQQTQNLLKAITDNLNPDLGNRGIILAAEAHSLPVITALKPQENIVIAFSSHQFNEGYQKLKDIADIIALPQHTLSPQDIKALSSDSTTVVQTVGVAHNLDRDTIRESYNQNQAKIPPANKYLGLILGGDAPKPEGEMLYYTAEEAQNLAKYVATGILKDNAHLLILNGPRTGKHDNKSKDPKVLDTSHRNGVQDPVTQSFIAQLKEEGFIEGENFTLFDFQYDQPSEYKTVLGALLVTASPLLVAGESTSMVSETADCLPSGLVTAYTHDAMNRNHFQHCTSEKDAGRIKLLENLGDKWKITEAPHSRQDQINIPASEMLAQAIYAKLKAKTEGEK
jgi:hypothetical protein